ncbi:uncharacterized protein ARMOST_18524 [Armillaria ostoyae]|uniref:Uncharacterized protein n=1 Tax=Armillaria ostoyae TaxID=47428 RepID=A0A284S208_ARMOS|nr:uncharacterized protein ARMOST_18524 [Armillaria ostoyae]
MPPKRAATKKKSAATKAKNPQPKKASAKRARASNVESDASSEESEPEVPAKRVKTDEKTTTQATNVVVEKADFAGKFDLYNMSLDYLRRLGNDYEVLYDAILERQEKLEFSAQVAIPKAPYFTEDGAAKDPAFCIEDMDMPPFPLRLKYIRSVDAVGYTDEELDFFPEGDDDSNSVRANAPGLMADLKLAGRNSSARCCSGKFLMHRSWTQTKRDGSIVELFEGYFDVSLSYGQMKYDGHACSVDSVFGFWAVRARKDEDGKEIGIELDSEDGGCCIGF